MVGEDVAQRRARPARAGAQAPVDGRDDVGARGRSAAHRLHAPPGRADRARQRAGGDERRRRRRRRAAAAAAGARPGPKTGFGAPGARRRSSSGTGRRAPGALRGLLVDRVAEQRDRAAGVRADLREGEDARRAPSRGGAAAAAACAGSTRTTTTGEPSSRLSAPSGSAVRSCPTSMSSARSGLAVGRRPAGARAATASSSGASPSSGPSAVDGHARARRASPAPATPAAAPSARRREIPSPPRRSSLGQRLVVLGLAASCAGGPRRRARWATTRLAGEHQRRRPGRPRPAPSVAPSSWVSAGATTMSTANAPRSGQARAGHEQRGRLARTSSAARGLARPLARARRTRRLGSAHGARSPISARDARAATAMASNHATMPSGIGPMLPMPQPPRSSGWRVDCDVARRSSSSVGAGRAGARRTSASGRARRGRLGDLRRRRVVERRRRRRR